GPKIIVVFDSIGLRDGQVELQRALLDGRCSQLHPAATRSIRLRYHQGDVKSSFNQFFQGGHRKMRCSSEDEIEWLRHKVLQMLTHLTTRPLSQVCESYVSSDHVSKR